ncbi:MAG TPA: XrtA/PEP-CTERM system-associated ATPase [Rhizomicrobium sp.]|nr:XrtA/PEP-CTERM system-associated ATPase [Rhizomicrobium sp.]
MYTSFYKLRAEPFLLTPDERFYFESSVHSQAMAHLTYGLKRGEGFIVITGDVGAGKTTLVKRLIATIDPSKIVAAHVVTTMLSGHDLLRMVAAAFGLKDLPPDKSGILLKLQEFFDATHREGRRALLIVDEAQNLSESALEELRMLSNFQAQNAAPPFQSFLVGQPQFRRIIAHPDLEQLRQRVIASYHLGPMNSLESGNYVLHRLKQVGWTGDPSFPMSTIDAIHQHTGGIPRRINTLGNRLLILGYLDELHAFSADDVNRVAADLANENEAVDLGGPVGTPANDQPLANQTAVAARLDDIEGRLAKQEALARRAAAIIQQFLTLITTETP